MVRTKQVRKKSSFVRRRTQNTVNNKISSESSSDNSVNIFLSKEYESYSDFINEFNTFYEGQMEKINKSYENSCSYIKNIVCEKLQAWPELFRKQNINEIQDDFQDQNLSPNTSPHPVRQPRSRKSIEVFDFKRPKTPRLASRSSNRQRSASASAASTSSSERFKTPVMSSRMMAMGHTITPKIYSNTPMSVMRRPQMGEMAVSLTGSPLLVGSITCEEVPTVNVPLQDGRVFSIMPQEGAPPLDLPDFDEQTKEYLRTLQAHLALLAPRTP